MQVDLNGKCKIPILSSGVTKIFTSPAPSQSATVLLFSPAVRRLQPLTVLTPSNLSAFIPSHSQLLHPNNRRLSIFSKPNSKLSLLPNTLHPLQHFPSGDISQKMASLNKKVSPSNVNLPNDLVLNILSRLPVKSLKRFSCVQKSWANLLEDPHFVDIYYENLTSKTRDSCLLLNQHVPNTVESYLFLLFGERYENRVKFDWPSPFHEDNESVIVVGSCVNGTICLQQVSMIDTTTSIKVLLWTPKTKEFKVVPPSLTAEPELQFQITITGFGYDHVTDDYKLIQNVLVHALNNDYAEVNPPLPGQFWQIYSVKSNCWRNLDLEMTCDVFPQPVGLAVYLNGVCHWLACEDHNQEPYDTDVLLVSFDMSSEMFVTTPISRYNHHDFCDRYLVVLKESVAVISMFENNNCFDVSILGEAGVEESWVKLFTVGLPTCVDHPIGAGKNGDIFFRKYDGALVWYDFSSKTIKEIGIKGEFCYSQTVML